MRATATGLLAALLLLGLGACYRFGPAGDATTTATVAARGETEPVGTPDDAADDPAVWRNPADPTASLIVATDKRAGLHIYDLAGKRLSFAPSPRLNNVDLRATPAGVIVVASDRADPADARVAIYRLDTAARRLVPLGQAAVGPGEAYGMCLWRRAADGALFGFVVMKEGTIVQLAIDPAAGTARAVRTLRLGSQSEGCVADDRTGKLYVAEEDVGLWRFDADPAASPAPTAVAEVDGRTLFADAEGLGLVPQGSDGGWLVASSQGDSAYAVYRLPDMAFAGRFRIGGRGSIGAASETDGLDVVAGDFGPRYPGGLLVVQDGDNAPAAQNFKLVAWGDVTKALGLD